MITLTPAQLDTLMAQVRADLVAKLMAEHKEAITLLSPAQAAGLLDINPQTLRGTDCPRVVIAPKVIKYRLSDITALIQRNLEQ